MPRSNGNSDKPDPGYNTRMGDDGKKPTGTAPGRVAGVGVYDSGVIGRCDLDTNKNIGCGYGSVSGKGKKD